jgi:hypothetical protein
VFENRAVIFEQPRNCLKTGQLSNLSRRRRKEKEFLASSFPIIAGFFLIANQRSRNESKNRQRDWLWKSFGIRENTVVTI